MNAGPLIRPRIVATYSYVGASGQLLYQTVRVTPKHFLRRRPRPGGGWEWRLDGDARLVLYRLPAVLAAVAAGGTVWIAEGENDADAVVLVGAVATTNVRGPGGWRADYTASLRGAREVIVVSDLDYPGVEHARQVAASLSLAGIRHRVVRPATGKDAADHLAAGYGLADFDPLPPGREL